MNWNMRVAVVVANFLLLGNPPLFANGGAW